VTTILDTEVNTPDMPPRERRVWPRVLAGAVVLALIGAGTGVLIYVRAYQPLTTGNGPFGSITPKTLKTVGDGLEDTNSVLVGPAGTKGTADYPIYNSGPHALTLLGLDRSQSAPFGLVLTWAPATNDSSDEVGQLSDARTFPVTLQPHEEVIVQETVTQPRCGKDSIPASLLGIPIRWSALGVHHVFDLNLQPPGAIAVPITICPPKAALTHVVP
jgi:hypothetical protein